MASLGMLTCGVNRARIRSLYVLVEVDTKRTKPASAGFSFLEQENQVIIYRLSTLLVSLALGACSLVASLADYSQEIFARVWRQIEAPISVKVEAVIAAAYAIKTQIVASYRAFRRSATNFAARRVVMLRGKGPVTA